MSDRRFFVSEESAELVFGGKKFRVRGLDLDTFIKVMRQYVLYGLVEAPFEITKENVDNLKPSLVFPLATKIINLSTKRMRDYSFRRKPENPLAA